MGDRAYFGLTSQIRSNNLKSMLLLAGFPLVIAGMAYAVLFLLYGDQVPVTQVNQRFLEILPFVVVGVGLWFLFAWMMHSSMIRAATGRRPLERRDNLRVYNLTENLCISCGMTMPKLYVIDSPALNAFASGIDKKSYAVTLTTGIIDKLDDKELSGVIAHELTHIRNKDVRLLIVSIIFVGIISFTVQLAFRSMLFSGGSRGRSGSNQGVFAILMLVGIVAFFITTLFRFALSRKREYLADAGAVELTHDPDGLARALRKISGNYEVEGITNEDVKQMFIQHSAQAHRGFRMRDIFATHPPIERRIAFLEQL